MNDKNNPDGPPWAGQNTTGEMARSESVVEPKSAYRANALVDVTKAHEAHKRRQTSGSVKASTFYMYDRTARRFADYAQLRKYRRRDLEGPTGKRLIVAYIDAVKKETPQSAKARLAGVESFWKYGLEMAWPIEAKRDLGKLAKPRRVECPPDFVVKKWADAMEGETDLRLKLAWYFITLGWRPQHVCLIKWRNIRRDEAGRPDYIRAAGRDEGFKTDALLLSALPPNLADALKKWEDANPGRASEDLIVPSASFGVFHWQRPMASSKDFNWLWHGLQKKHGLPDLMARQMRHWVKTACREAEMSYPATCAMQGHEWTAGDAAMGYDTPGDAALLRDQREALAFGPLGRLGIGPVMQMAAPDVVTPALRAALEGYASGRVKLSAVMDAVSELPGQRRPDSKSEPAYPAAGR